MKKITLILAALVVGASLSAQTPAPAPAPAAPSYSLTTDVTYTSRYVFRGVKLASSALQPSLKITSGDFYGSVWGSAPLTRNYELEFDYAGGYSTKLDDKWSVDVGATLYTYPGLESGPGVHKSTFEPYVGFNGSFGDFGSATYAYYDFTLDTFTFQQAVSYTTKLNEQANVVISVNIGRASPSEGQGYTYYGVDVSVPYKLSDKATVTLGAHAASQNLSGVDGGHYWGTLGFTYAF